MRMATASIRILYFTKLPFVICINIQFLFTLCNSQTCNRITGNVQRSYQHLDRTIDCKNQRISNQRLFSGESYTGKDGEKDIAALGVLVKEHFGDAAEPLYERLAKYFQILDSYSFGEWKE